MLGRSPRSVAARPLPWRPAPLLIALLLGGCSGTPFGESLSRSFSGSPAAPPTGGAATPGAGGALPRRSPAGAIPGAASPGTRPAPSPAAGTTPTAPATAPAAAAPATAAAATGARAPANPAPYRVTILLPQADPAAPAEVVTRALRAAGVPFEVETIQRTAPGESPRPVAPALPPAPAPAAATPSAAPAVRPAPLPR